jgi:hypothetical protein
MCMSLVPLGRCWAHFMKEYDITAKPLAKAWRLNPGVEPVNRKYSTKPPNLIATSTSPRPSSSEWLLASDVMVRGSPALLSCFRRGRLALFRMTR